MAAGLMTYMVCLQVPDGAYSCLAAACLHLTLQTANMTQEAPGMTQICSAVGCSNIGAAVKMVEKLKATLQGDTSSVSVSVNNMQV